MTPPAVDPELLLGLWQRLAGLVQRYPPRATPDGVDYAPTIAGAALEFGIDPARLGARIELGNDFEGAPRVQVLSGSEDEALSNFWRVGWPAAALRARGYPVQIWRSNADDERMPWVPDLVVIPRMIPSQGYAADMWLRAMRETGATFVWDLDDDLVRIPEFTPRQRALLEYYDYQEDIVAEQRVQLRVFLAHCHGCTVSTPALAEVVRPFVKPGAPVLVVPNAINPELYVEAGQTREHVAPLTVGWAGTPRWGLDFEGTGMSEAWARIAQRYPEIVFMVIGGRPSFLRRCNIPDQRVRALGLQPFQDYPAALAMIDIACCPLENMPFNHCKGPQKAWEFALTGAAVVASPTVYGDDLGFTENGGLLAEGADQWEAQLGRLIENEQERRGRVESLRKFVLTERALEPNLWRWPEAWRTIVSQARTSR